MATARCCDLDGVARFADRAELYARGRPSYPQSAIQAILSHVATPQPVVIDVGAGTGIATRLLANDGGPVAAVDPSMDMLIVGRPPHALVAKAEILPFRTSSADLMTTFNAFHWFQAEDFLGDARRVLRHGGVLAVVWNDWNRDDPFTDQFVTLMRSEAGDYPPEDRDAEVAPLYATDHFEVVEAARFANEHEMTRDLLRARMQSMTFVPKEGPSWERVSSELDGLFNGYADERGHVTHRYWTSVFIARPR